MKIDRLKTGREDLKLDKYKIKELFISNHGCSYRITSDFIGLKIERLDSEHILIFPDNSSTVILK